jgi:mRNA interferase RelE/StbE
MIYKVLLTPAAKRQFGKLPRPVQKRLAEVIDGLAKQPRSAQSAKLTGYDLYKVRCGDYRVVYRIEDDRLQVLIVKLGHRREVYR